MIGKAGVLPCGEQIIAKNSELLVAVLIMGMKRAFAHSPDGIRAALVAGRRRGGTPLRQLA